MNVAILVLVVFMIVFSMSTWPKIGGFTDVADSNYAAQVRGGIFFTLIFGVAVIVLSIIAIAVKGP